MWKCFSRNIQGTFEKARYGCNKVPITKVTQDSRVCDYLLKFSPVLVEHLNRYKYGHKISYPGSWKEKRRKDQKAKQGCCFDTLHFSWLKALSWTPALFLGWYLCQWSNLHKKYRPDSNFSTFQSKFQSDNYPALVQYFTQRILSNSLNYVLPQVNAVGARTTGLKIKNDPSASNEETVKKNLDNLERAHNTVTSALSNWRGTECMQLGKHKEAVSHFNEAAGEDNAAAMFNLGICYELGLGLRQDFKQAAEQYKRASKLGHATAMYNLGIFHIHGWGGVEVDVDQAGKLFKAAAELGQVDAKKALGLRKTKFELKNLEEEKSQQEVPVKPLVRENYTHLVEPEMTDSTGLWFNVLNINLGRVESEPKERKGKRLISVDSGVLDLSPQEDLDIYV